YMRRGMSAWILRNARVTLPSLLGLLVAFAMVPGTAHAQHRGFSHSHHAMRQSGGSGYGGWIHGNTSSFYTFNHNRGGNRSSAHRHGGNRGHRGAVAAFPQPYPYLPFLNYGSTYPLDDSLEFNDNGDDNGPDYNGPENPPPPNPVQATMQMNQAAIVNQLRQLHAEVQDLKAAEAAAPPPAPAYPRAASESEPQQPPVTLVLRNGQQLTVSDYAVMDQTFWDFSKRPVYKIPLSSIDMAASQRATAAAGGEFPALPVNP
ncbi:MAG: hypothetical protein ACRD6B_22305, partial [Bryobacteraceae bacterium]